MSATDIRTASQDKSTSFLKSVVLFVVVFTAVGLMATTFMMQAQKSEYDQLFQSRVGQERELTLGLLQDVPEATMGRAEAFERLRDARVQFGQLVESQLEGDNSGQIIAVPTPTVDIAISELNEVWQQASRQIETILSGQEAIEDAERLVREVESLIPELQALSDEVAASLIDAGAPSHQVYIASRQLLLLARIENNAARMLSGDMSSATSADRFGRDVALFGRVLDAMRKGDPGLGIAATMDLTARNLLRQVSDRFVELEKSAGKLLARSAELFEVTAAGQELGTLAVALREAVDKVATQFAIVSEPRARMSMLFGILSAVLLAGVAIWQIAESRSGARRSEAQKRAVSEQNERNQNAILTLLDEMGDLADGDLTVHANVTEELTGAIADSVNYAVEALRDLVTTINNTSKRVANAAAETVNIADQLAGQAAEQAKKIVSASDSVDDMARSMTDMSTNAAASAEVAANSVNIASQGADRVRRTIQGMDVIREHIQETSKRIKRLGESSQEIGDIVGLINDIADQTNILALNAAIQASAAGESGRGFAVVADEVQRLAERATSSTKRIEALVKTIQADTSEAIISMEKSTGEVVNGAELAENAGESLEEIENVSKRLADLINDISHAARLQSEVASGVSTTMTAINEIARLTSGGTRATSESVSAMTKLSEELRQSVSGFKLPDRGAAQPAAMEHVLDDSEARSVAA